MKQLLVCPFTFKPLRQLSESELDRFHSRIDSGDFYFQKGIPLNFLPNKAYVSQNQVYIYLEIDGVILLQKQTAVVTRIHTENPQRRISEELVENFYNELGLNIEGSLEHKPVRDAITATSDDQAIFKQVLPKSGQCFVSMGSTDIDTVHNFLFGTSFSEHLHVDHNMARLLSVEGALKENTRYVLCDQGVLPVERQSVNALLCFDTMAALDKQFHQPVFDELREVMKSDAVAVMLKASQKSSAFEGKYKMAKTKAALKPWKKHHLPRFHFHSIEASTGMNHDALSGKTSWGSQLS